MNRKLFLLLVLGVVLCSANEWGYYRNGKLEFLVPLPSTLRDGKIKFFKTPQGKRIGVDNRIIFKPKSKECKEKILERYKEKKYFLLSNGDIVIFTKDTKEAFELSKELFETNCTVFAHPDFLLIPKKRSIDPLFFPQQWNYHNIGQYGIVPNVDLDVFEAWQFATGKGVKIALIDNGFDFLHPDLQGAYVASIDLVEYDEDASYDNGFELHGTACAGLIVGRANERGVRGAAYDASLIAIKLMGSYPSGEDKLLYTSNIVNSFLYANEKGAEVINCSWGTYDVEDAVREVIDYLATEGRDGKGIPIIFASGNDGRGQWYWAHDESALPSVLAIGAVTDQGEVAWYSNYGPALDFVAPSGGGLLNIATTDISGMLGYADGSFGHPNYCYAIDDTGFNGTSAAAPQVTAVIALMLERNPELTKNGIVEILKKTAKKIGSTPYVDGRNDYMGYGLVDADDAVQEAIKRFVERKVVNRSFLISGYFVRFGNDKFDWLYVDRDLRFVAKLQGIDRESKHLLWKPSSSTFVEKRGDKLIFDGDFVGEYIISGYFSQFGQGAYDWIYIDRETKQPYKLEGLDYEGNFLWVSLKGTIPTLKGKEIIFKK